MKKALGTSGLRKPAKRTMGSAAFDEIGVALGDAKTVGQGGDGSTRVEISPDAIVRIDNPRDIPCSLEECRQVAWPPLDTDTDSVEARLEEAMNPYGWFQKRSTVERREAVEFFSGIHTLARSIRDNKQLQPIILERDDPLSETAYLVSGERRTIAGIYARWEIKHLVADVFNSRLPALQRAIFQDQENTQSKLRPHEIVMSKRNVYRALLAEEGEKGFSLPHLARVWGYSTTSVPSILKRIFENEREADLLTVIRRDKMGWREIERLIQRVSSDSKYLEKALKAVNGHPVDGRKPSTVEGRDGRPSNELVKRAARYGFAYKPRGDYTVFQALIAAASGGDQLPKKAEAIIKKGNYTSPEGMVQVWAELADVLAGGNNNG